MHHKGRKHLAAICVLLAGPASSSSAAPFFAQPLDGDSPAFTGARLHKVVVFGRNSRRTVEEFASDQKLDASNLRRKFAASGLIQCGAAHGAGQLTLTDDLVTTAAHVFFNEDGALRAKTCTFVNEVEGRQVRTQIDSSSIVAGNKNPYAAAAVHDWAVARLTRPVKGATPYGLAGAESPNAPVEFVARGHIDWGKGRDLSMEKCALHDQLSVGEEGTREFSFDCETGDGASGGALIVGEKGDPLVGAILVGWRSNKPFQSAPFSPTHYNFAVTIEGAFKGAIVASAARTVAARKALEPGAGAL